MTHTAAPSRFIAAIAGPVIIAVAVSLLLNPGLIGALAGSLQASAALMMISGIVGLIVGLAIVKSHNVWRGWAVAVTLLGWLIVLTALARIVIPDVVASTFVGLGQTQGGGLAPVAGGVALLIGLFFTWQGWLAGPLAPAHEG